MESGYQAATENEFCPCAPVSQQSNATYFCNIMPMTCKQYIRKWTLLRALCRYTDQPAATFGVWTKASLSASIMITLMKRWSYLLFGSPHRTYDIQWESTIFESLSEKEHTNMIKATYPLYDVWCKVWIVNHWQLLCQIQSHHSCYHLKVIESIEDL